MISHPVPSDSSGAPQDAADNPGETEGVRRPSPLLGGEIVVWPSSAAACWRDEATQDSLLEARWSPSHWLLDELWRPSDPRPRHRALPDTCTSGTEYPDLRGAGWTEGRHDRSAPARPRLGLRRHQSRDTDPQPAPFAQRVRREAERRGFHHARRQVVLGDGAAWIWNICRECSPNAIQIVDLFHSKEHLWTVAKKLFPDDRPRLCAEPTTGTSTACSRPCSAKRRAPAPPTSRPIASECATPTSGPNLSGGLQEHVKRGGMHWTVDGANSILALRSCVLSGRYEDYWAYRADQTPPASKI